MNYNLIFLIFSGVIVAVSCDVLKCITCEVVGEGEENCDGEEENCENEDDFCITQIEDNLLRDDLKTTVRKRCMKKEDEKLCFNYLTLNTGEFKYHLYSECCNETCCNSKGIKMPEEDNEPNGFSCDTCFVEDSLECTDITTEQCVGSQKQCFSLTGEAARPEEDFKEYEFKGCVTNYACLFNLHDLPGSRLAEDAEYSCTDPSE